MKRQWILMSVSALLVCCLFVFTPSMVFADAVDSSAYYQNKLFYLSPSGASSTDNSDLYASLLCTGFYAYDEHLNPVSYTYSNNIYRLVGLPNGYIKCMYKLVVRNTTNNDLIIPATNIRISLTPVVTVTSMELVDIDWNGGQLMVDRVNGSGNFYFSNAPDNALFSYIVVPKNGDISCVFECTYEWNGSTSQQGASGISLEVSGFNVTWVYPSIPVSPVVVESGDAVFTSYESYLPYIYYAVTGIWDSLQDQQQAGTGSAETGQETQEQIEEVHETEQPWYTGAEEDIEATGLSQFSFDQSTTTGLTGVSGMFVQFWNAVPAVTVLTTTGMSLKLASTILRHLPRRRKE